MSSRIMRGMEEYFLMDEKVIEYINEILKNIVKSQYTLKKEFTGILEPENVEYIALLLKNDNDVNFDLAKNIHDLITFAYKYLRVVQRKSYTTIVDEGEAKKSLDRAKAEYRARAVALLKKAGYTNEEQLIMSFSAKLTKLISKKEALERKTTEEFLDLDI